jgi:spore coat protein U-like protein
MTYEGASIDLTLYYYCRPTQGRLVASESQISTTVTMGTTRIYPVVITNQGKGSTGRISLSLPNVDWLTAATPTVMSPLEYGDSATIMLRFTATTDMALNVPSTGTIGVNCENGNGLAITYSMEPVSDLTGTLTVNVTDEYTYYLDKAPGVVDATVTVRHPTTGTIVAQGISSNDGLFTTELPEGYYRIDVEAQKHSSYTNYVLVKPGYHL